jgi:archaellum component FlaF (FlaF/FlaG flagellin family)
MPALLPHRIMSFIFSTLFLYIYLFIHELLFTSYLYSSYLMSYQDVIAVAQNFVEKREREK